MNQDNDFRDRLVSAQQLTPAYREKYERRLETMISPRMTVLQRLTLFISVLVGLAALAVLAYLLAVDTQTSIEFKYAIGFLGLVVLAITIIRGIIVVTGRVNLRSQPKMIAYISYVGILLFVGALVIIVTPIAGSTNSIYYLVVGLIPLIVATVKIILTHIDQSELNVREKMLEIELRLAEMNERLEKKQN